MANSPLNDFISKVKSQGLARTNRYTVLFTGFTSGRSRDAMLLCDQVQLPGTNFNTADIRTFGETRKTPYERLYEDINMSFYVDTDMRVKELFDDWMTWIQDPTTRNFEYYDDYTCDIIIEVQDLKNQSRYGIKLFEAYPKSIGAIQLDYAAKDVMKMSVNFAYKYYLIGEFGSIANSDNNEEGMFSPFQFLGDSLSEYAPLFNDIVGLAEAQTDPLNNFTNNLKSFAVGGVTSKVVSKLPSFFKGF